MSPSIILSSLKELIAFAHFCFVAKWQPQAYYRNFQACFGGLIWSRVHVVESTSSNLFDQSCLIL
jgi:transposase